MRYKKHEINSILKNYFLLIEKTMYVCKSQFSPKSRNIWPPEELHLQIQMITGLQIVQGQSVEDFKQPEMCTQV